MRRRRNTLGFLKLQQQGSSHAHRNRMKKGGVVIRRDKMRFRSSERENSATASNRLTVSVSADDGVPRPSWTNPTYRNPE